MIDTDFMRVEEVVRSERLPAVVIGDLTLVRPLARAGIPAVVVATDAHDITLSSRHVAGHLIVPRLEGAEAVARLVQLSRLLRSPVPPPLFYGSDESLDFVSRHRRELAPHFSFLLNDGALTAALSDKALFNQLAAEAGIAAPVTLDDTHQLDELRPPLLVKPKRKVAWKPLQKALFAGEGKARVFADADELRADAAFQRYQHDLVVQEYIQGGEVYSYHAFADADACELASFCGRKIRSFPLVTGGSACIELAVEPELEELGREVVRRIGLVGPCKLDVIRDARDGRWVVLEVNARYNLWHYLGAVHGINLLKVAYDYLTGGTVETMRAYRPNVRWCNLYRDYRAFLALHRRHELSAMQWLREVVFAPTIYEAFAWDDPLPATRWLMQQVRGKVKGWHATA